MIRACLTFSAFVLLAACARDGVIEGPPTPLPGLPSFANAPASYGTLDEPDKFGPGRARIEGNSFYYIADFETTDLHNNWDKNIFSRRIRYDPEARTLRSDHRGLALVYDADKQAFVGTIQHPKTRKRRHLEVSVPEAELPS